MSSAGDIGTMCSNMNIISCTNAKTTNVLDNLNSCKEYVTMETDAFVVAAMMKYFRLNDINIPTESFVPPNILNANTQQKRIWLNKHIKAMLEKFVMKEQQSVHEEIQYAVQTASNPQILQRFQCRICQKPYKYAKARDNHEIKIHGVVLQLENTENQNTHEPEDNNVDERYSTN